MICDFRPASIPVVGKFIDLLDESFYSVCESQNNDIPIKIEDVDLEARESSARNYDQPLYAL